MPKVVKVKDKWKAKTWLDVLSASVFGNVSVASIPINESGGAVGRVISCSLYDIFKDDPSYNNIKLYFKIDRVEGDKAYTHLKGIEYAREFLRGMVRRGSSIVELIKDYKTLDGTSIRMYLAIFSLKSLNTARKHRIRLGVDKVLKEKIPTITLDQLVQITVTNKLSESITENIKKIERVKHVGVAKLKVLDYHQVDINQTVPAA